MRARMLVVPLMFITAACGSNRPSAVVETYLDAQIRGDAETAWMMLSEDTRAWLPREVFTADDADTQKLREAYAKDMKFEVVDEVINGEAAEVVVRMTGPDFSAVARGTAREGQRASWFRIYELQREDRKWRIVIDPGVDEVLQSFSEAILKPFLEAARDTGDKALGIFEKGLDLSERFLDIVAQDLDTQTRGGRPSFPISEASNEPGDAPPPRLEERWRHKLTVDPMTDVERHVFWRTADRARLEVWCDKDRDTRVIVHSGKFLGLGSDGFDFEHSTMRVRVGDGDAIETKGLLHANSRMIEIPDGQAVADQMLAASDGTVRVELRDAFDSPYIVGFDISGFDSTVQSSGAPCSGATD